MDVHKRHMTFVSALKDFYFERSYYSQKQESKCQCIMSVSQVAIPGGGGDADGSRWVTAHAAGSDPGGEP